MAGSAIHDRRNKRIVEFGERYWQKMLGQSPGLFNRHHWHGKLLDWIMDDESFKVDAFRLVDVLPALKTSSAIASHVREYLLKENREMPRSIRTALNMAAGGFGSTLATKAIRSNVTDMARLFICESESGKDLKVFSRLGKEGASIGVKGSGQ